LIGNYFGKLELYGNCFHDNESQLAPVISQSDEPLAVISNHNNGVSKISIKSSCEFIATFENVTTFGQTPSQDNQDHNDFTCIDFDGPSCIPGDDKSEPSAKSIGSTPLMPTWDVATSAAVGHHRDWLKLSSLIPLFLFL
jgi:hypothetical protein